uniref:Uncharacterized protein n=1 Tax=Acanthochromis polyacanthus TaxID=80966 RepID=A0A3Q1FT90_9TELE
MALPRSLSLSSSLSGSLVSSHLIVNFFPGPERSCRGSDVPHHHPDERRPGEV